MDEASPATAHRHGVKGTTDAPITVGILTCSDRGARGERADVSGPTLHNLVIDRLAGVVRQYRVVPDERGPIEATIRDWSDHHRLDLVLTTGGTGLSARDVTPDATRATCDREIPAIAQAMVLASLSVTPYAMLTRATAGIRKRTLVVNLPGNPKALAENFDAIAEVLPHAIDIIRGVDTHGMSAHGHARATSMGRDHGNGQKHAHGHQASSSNQGADLDGRASSSGSSGPIARNVGGPPC
jgi:molybdenum cofactor synthesis domain-containing protein